MVEAPALDVAGDIASPGAHMTGASPTMGAVFFMTLLMAAASGLGAVPFFFVRRLSPRLAALANALACGVMLAASFDLVHEGEPHGALLVVVGVCLGAVFIALTQRALRDQEDVRFGQERRERREGPERPESLESLENLESLPRCQQPFETSCTSCVVTGSLMTTTGPRWNAASQ